MTIFNRDIDRIKPRRILIQIDKSRWGILLKELKPYLNSGEFKYSCDERRELIENTIFVGNNKIFLLVKNNPNNIIILSQYTPKQLTLELEILPKHLFNKIKAAFNGTALQFPEIDEKERLEYQQAKLKKMDLWQQCCNLINKVNKEVGLSPETPFGLNKNEIKVVEQGTLAVASANDKRHILASRSAAPCVILAIYNPIKHSGLLTHIDYEVETDSLDKYINQMCSGDTICEVHMIGGEPFAIDHYAELIEKVTNNPRLKLKTCFLAKDNFDRLALDVKTGEIIYSEEPLEKIINSMEDSISGIPDEELANKLHAPFPRPIVDISDRSLKVSEIHSIFNRAQLFNKDDMTKVRLISTPNLFQK